MKPDYARPLHSSNDVVGPKSTRRVASASSQSFSAVFYGATSKKAVQIRMPKLDLMTDEPQVAGPLERSYRALAGATEPRRQPPGCTLSSVESNCRTLRKAEADPNYAWEAATLYAFTPFTGPLLDRTDPDNVRYSATGELVTPERTAYYSRVAAALGKQMVDLFHRERDLGVPPAVILSQLFGLMEAQPREFLEMTSW